MSNDERSHERDVARIARALSAQRGTPGAVRIAKGGVSHFVPVPGDPRRSARPIDIRRLRRILSIDPEARRCTAEPGVTFAKLLRATLEHGLMPQVVPELEGITLGGAVAGCSIESSSHRYGGFHDSCLEYEILTGRGELCTCSPAGDSLVFDMMHGSFGTLGILTKLSFKLVPACPYVRMEYLHFSSFEPFQEELIGRAKAGDVDFIDAIAHGPKSFVICLGRGVKRAPYVSSYRWLDIYYLSTRRRREDYLNTFDYCFRYDTECHWLSSTVPLLGRKAVRLALGKLVLGSTNLIRWSQRLERVLGAKERPDLVCDVFIPARRFSDFYDWYRRSLAFFPLWIVPYRVPRPYPWISPQREARMQDDLFIDCAVYGMPNGDPTVDYSEVLEQAVFDLDGIKTLISRNHYTVKRFWEIYHRENYDEVKRRLDPDGLFGGLYEKCHRVR